MKQVKFRRPHYDREGNFSHFSYWGKISFNKDFSESSFTSPTFNSKCTYKEDEQFTCAKDKNGIEIFSGDILSDYVKTDEGLKQSLVHVFWNGKKLRWDLDMSHKQDKTYSYPLATELDQYDYEITGNIHENPKLIKT